MISQFYFELLDSLSKVFWKFSKRNTLFESESEPNKVYLFMISVPFCKICFSQRSYFGRLEIWVEAKS